MAPKSNQLKEKFDAFMGEDDDDSVGSGRGSIGGKLAGLSGLKPTSPAKLGIPSPAKPRLGLGNLGTPPSSKLGKPAGGIGIGKLGGLTTKHAGGTSKPAETVGISKLGGLATGGIGKPAGGLGKPTSTSDVEETLSKLSLSVKQVNSELKSSVESNVEALKSITSLVQGLAEKTVASFQEVSNRLNQTREYSGLQDSLDALIKNMDEEISAKGENEAYIVIPGHETSTVTAEEAAKILKKKSVRVFGSVSKLATVCNKSF